MAKVDIVKIGVVEDGRASHWTFDGKGRDLAALNMDAGTIGGWTLEELARISEQAKAGTIKAPVLGCE